MSQQIRAGLAWLGIKFKVQARKDGSQIYEQGLAWARKLIRFPAWLELKLEKENHGSIHPDMFVYLDASKTMAYMRPNRQFRDIPLDANLN